MEKDFSFNYVSLNFSQIFSQKIDFGGQQGAIRVSYGHQNLGLECFQPNY